MSSRPTLCLLYILLALSLSMGCSSGDSSHGNEDEQDAPPVIPADTVDSYAGEMFIDVPDANPSQPEELDSLPSPDLHDSSAIEDAKEHDEGETKGQQGIDTAPIEDLLDSKSSDHTDEGVDTGPMALDSTQEETVEGELIEDAESSEDSNASTLPDTTQTPSPCENAPCLNQGSCIPNESEYTCDCEGTGYEGALCEIDLNECADSPCNGGNCENLPGKFECTCPEHYSGPTCEQCMENHFGASCSPCPAMEGGSPCNGQGSCDWGIEGSGICSCFPNWGGTHCDLFSEGGCQGAPCLNGGACISSEQGFSCDCSESGHQGDFCENDINECADSPCKNGSPCTNLTGSFSCDCSLINFVGKLCDEPIPYHFVDVTESAGLSYMQSSVELINGSQLGSCTQYDTAEDMCGPTLTGGATAADFDNDGYMDLFVTRLDDTDILFRNKGDGSFENISEEVGLTIVAPTNGVVSGDLDNDGDQDLYLSTMGGDRFYVLMNQLNPADDANPGTLSFTEEAETRGIDLGGMGTTWGMSLSLGDYDLDGWLDIHTTEWHTYHDAIGLEENHARLLRNLGASNPAHFEDRTVQAGVGMINYSPLYKNWQLYSLASSFSDLDQDGWPDLIVTGDYYTSRLFWNKKDGTFSNGTSLAGINGASAAMGSAIGDLDGDGLLDWFVSSLYDVDENYFDSKVGNRLYRNKGDRSFKDITNQHTDVHIGYWGWGTTFGDFDNDGDLDLVLTNGQDTSLDNSEEFEDFYLTDPMRYWENIEGVLTPREAEVGLTDTGDGKGLLTFDYDNDGDLDIFITRTAGPPLLYRNDGDSHGDFLRLKLRGTASNRDALGARVELLEKQDGPTQVRELRGGSNFLSQNEAVIHFGMAKSEGAGAIHEIRIHWPRPGGAPSTQILQGVARNSTLEITEPP